MPDVVKASICGYSHSEDAVDVVIAMRFGADSVLSGGINQPAAHASGYRSTQELIWRNGADIKTGVVEHA